ncbi:MAG: F0F1 ATP synthase subunit B [Oscillospiraceae bacterium]|nr:F0F1 ATP synthase subunit B [Oscillospiraceae bacterium]
MDLQPVDIIIHIINIIVLFLLLRLLVYKPVRKYMLSREEKIKNEMNEADQYRQESVSLKKQYEASMTGAKDKLSKAMRDQQQKAEKEAGDIIAGAKTKAASIEEQARAQAEEEKRRAVRSMNEEITNLALDMASKILRREVRLEDNRALVDDFVKKAGENYAGSNPENRASL